MKDSNEATLALEPGVYASLPVAWRLYLPEGWANDRARRAKAGVPEDVVFRTKPEIALDQIRTALSSGVPSGVVLADAGYGVDTAFRSGLTAMGLPYIVGIQSSTSLWPPGMSSSASVCRPLWAKGNMIASSSRE